MLIIALIVVAAVVIRLMTVDERKKYTARALEFGQQIRAARANIRPCEPLRYQPARAHAARLRRAGDCHGAGLRVRDGQLSSAGQRRPADHRRRVVAAAVGRIRGAELHGTHCHPDRLRPAGAAPGTARRPHRACRGVRRRGRDGRSRAADRQSGGRERRLDRCAVRRVRSCSPCRSRPGRFDHRR